SASLLERLQKGADDDAWRRLVDVYTPLIRGWLRRQAALQDGDADDLTQEVLAALLQHLPKFEHNQRPGAFRALLRTLTGNRLRDFWRRQRAGGRAVGCAPAALLAELEDPASGLSRLWDEQHDRHVAATLLERVRGEFTATTWEAFRGVALEGRV